MQIGKVNVTLELTPYLGSMAEIIKFFIFPEMATRYSLYYDWINHKEWDCNDDCTGDFIQSCLQNMDIANNFLNLYKFYNVDNGPEYIR